MATESYSILPVKKIPTISTGDNLPLIIASVLQESYPIVAGDILVVTHKIVSIAEGSLYVLEDIEVSERARRISSMIHRDERITEIALREATEVIREKPVLITRTKKGIITDMSGVDASNAPPNHIVVLPKDPDISAMRISKALLETFGNHVPVLISDTQGRPWRRHTTNTCIGIYGMDPFIKNAGKMDLYGRTLSSSLVCLADELASAAELVMGQADERVPAVIIRGVNYTYSIDSSSRNILREPSSNLFI